MKRKHWVIIIPAIIVILGMIGYVRGEEYGIYTALLSSLKLLKVNLDILPPNPFLEAARWIGVVFFFGLIYTTFMAVVETGRTWKRVKREDAVAIHGDGVYTEQLAKALGKRCIRSDSRLSFKAEKQVIMFDSDAKSLDFYQTYADKLRNAREVHLCLELGSHVSPEKNNVFLVNTSEVKAISYWRKYWCSEEKTIAVLGSGQLAEAVLYWGLLTNIYDRECRIRYIVFGNMERFQGIHPDLADMLAQYGADSIEFVRDDWYRNTGLLAEADRIILCGNTWENVELADILCDAGYRADLHVFTDNGNISALLDTEKCIPVGMISDDNIEGILLMDDIHRAGKLCHAAYMLGEKDEDRILTYADVDSYVGSEEFNEGYKKDGTYYVGGWKSLDVFTRGSNYSAAIHDSVKDKLLKDEGIDVRGMDTAKNREAIRRLTPDTLDRLREIEHIRWCRYHFLNHWKAPEGEIILGGKKKNKDARKRLHSCLVPYPELSWEDKKKDAYFYETLSLRMGE